MEEHVHEIEVHAEVELLSVHNVAGALKRMEPQSRFVRGHDKLKVRLLTVKILIKPIENLLQLSGIFGTQVHHALALEDLKRHVGRINVWF